MLWIGGRTEVVDVVDTVEGGGGIGVLESRWEDGRRRGDEGGTGTGISVAGT